MPVEQIHVDTQSNSVSPSLSFCDAETRTQTEIKGEFLDLLEFELKSTGEEKDKLAKEKDELTRDSKNTSACTEKSAVWHFVI